MGVYNPDPIQAIWLFAHVWVGSGNIDRTVGTFLLNVDARFPRLTEPVFDGLTLAAGAFAILNFTIKVPSTVEDTNYLGNCCLMQFNWHDIGRYFDRGVFVFAVSSGAAVDSNDEEVAEALVEDQFRGDAGIRTTEDDCERLLSRDQRGTTGVTRKHRRRRLICDETPVAVAKASQSFDCGDHGGRTVLCCPPNYN
jgi:hypothetical protein